MSTFKEHVCWNVQAVRSVTPVDAASLTDPQFQAIHHPLALRRSSLSNERGGRQVREDQIVGALKQAVREDGFLLIPIVGASGTGKSHLVRWLHAQTFDTPDWVCRYLPKNRTGIRQTIQIIIDGLEGPAIDAAREALNSAPARNLSDAQVGELMLDQINYLIGNPELLPLHTHELSKVQIQLREKLIRELPDLFRDPVVRKKLLAEGAVIPRLVKLALRGRQEGDGLDDDATRFGPSDMPLTIAEIREASTVAQTTLGLLQTVPELLAEAVDLINEALPTAEKNISFAGSVELTEILREVRRAFRKEGKELVLFIEEMVVLHSVEREFLDAIIEPARSDEGNMCNLRIVFAVTPGHFDGLDTVRTRCEDAYFLDAPFGDGGVELEDAASFLGRYFNASRLAPETLNEAWTHRHDEHWLPNACLACPHQENCHETFGKSQEGFGLYPLNRTAIERLVPALPSRERHNAFDSREIVKKLVGHFLLAGRQELSESAFPSDEVFDVFDGVEPLSALLASQIQIERPEDSPRVTNVVRYWGEGEQNCSVKEGIFESFGLVRFAVNGAASTDGDIVEPPLVSELKPVLAEPGVRIGRNLLDARKQRIFDELENWHGESKLLSAVATKDLRRLVAETIRSNLYQGAVPYFFPRTGDLLPMVSIRNSATVQQSFDTAPVVLEPEPLTALSLQAMLLSEIDDQSFFEAEVFRQHLAASIEKWTAQVASQLMGEPTPEAVRTVEGLIAVGSILGNVQTTGSPTEIAQTLFMGAEGRSVQREGRWANLYDSALKLHPPLLAKVTEMFGESRQNGAATTIQADRLLPIVDKFTSNWTLESSDPATARLMRDLQAVVPNEWERLKRNVEVIEPHVDVKRSWLDHIEKVLACVDVAHVAGRLRSPDGRANLHALAASFSDQAMASYRNARDMVSNPRSFQAQLGYVAGSVPEDLELMQRFTEAADSIFSEIEEDLIEHRAAGGTNDLQATIDRVLEELQRFSDLAEDSDS